MNIQKKILLYFSFTSISLLGLALLVVYTIFSEYREEEFQQRQKEKISTTLTFLTQIKQTEDELIEALDQLTINDLYDEKLLLFNQKKELIYSSLDDTPILMSKEMLSELNEENKWIETKDKQYDIVGTYIKKSGRTFYGISKAYDTFGYSKLNFLKKIFLIAFSIFALIIVIVSFRLSRVISRPLQTITSHINNFNFEHDYTPLTVEKSKNEISILALQFNKLMKRVNDAYLFQRHAIHHISHELKTPISVLVSNFERIEKESDPQKIKALIQLQKEDTKSLSEIINSLLEIAKAETISSLPKEKVRADELIFDISHELKTIYPHFQFSVGYTSASINENMLTINANSRLLKAAMLNLMVNCVHYSSNNKASIMIAEKEHSLIITLENRGKVLSEKEKEFLFQHFFRGKNSSGKRGFGLGLVLIHKIISLHGGKVTYSTPHDHSNVFTITLPLS